MLPFRASDRAGWPAVVLATLLGVVASFAVLGGAWLGAVALDPGDPVLWLVLLLMPTTGGVVAGALTPDGPSASVGSGLLVGLSLGAIVVTVGIAQFYDVLGGDRALAWLFWGAVGTPFSMLLSGFGGVLGAGVFELRASSRDRSTTDSAGEGQSAAAADVGRPSTDDAAERPMESADKRDRQSTGDTDDPTSDAGEDPAAEPAADWRSSTLGMGRAILEGTGATFVLGLVGLIAGPLVLGGPFLGGFLAGYRSPGGIGNGTFCGLATGILTTVLTLTLIVLEINSQAYVGPGVGIAILIFAAVLFLAIPLAAIGGFAGAKAAASDESRTDEPEAPADSVES